MLKPDAPSDRSDVFIALVVVGVMAAIGYYSFTAGNTLTPYDETFTELYSESLEPASIVDIPIRSSPHNDESYLEFLAQTSQGEYISSAPSRAQYQENQSEILEAEEFFRVPEITSTPATNLELEAPVPVSATPEGEVPPEYRTLPLPPRDNTPTLAPVRPPSPSLEPTQAEPQKEIEEIPTKKVKTTTGEYITSSKPCVLVVGVFGNKRNRDNVVNRLRNADYQVASGELRNGDYVGVPCDCVGFEELRDELEEYFAARPYLLRK